MTVEQVIALARDLSPGDRAAIVAAIDPAADEFRITDAVRADLDKRWAAYEADPTNVITLEQLKATLAAGR